ncbi:MAG: adenylate kinase [Omnitrophica bacterium GWA2_52_12]|nr:MAG: adenylate kinase [Omnitrophica bacterium GWA2_52_12]
MKMVLLGPPGAGKGTHAKILCDKYSLTHMATGDILRGHIRQKTELGLKAKDVIEKGGLVSDDLVNAMMFFEIERAGLRHGLLLDGYPRTIGQAEALDAFLVERNAPLDIVLNFATSSHVLLDRLSGRRVCAKCSANYHIRNIPPKKAGICDQCGEALTQRKDDQPETIKNRLEMYDRETSPLIQYYRKKNLLQDVHGDYDIPELQIELKQLFEKLNLAV